MKRKKHPSCTTLCAFRWIIISISLLIYLGEKLPLCKRNTLLQREPFLTMTFTDNRSPVFLWFFPTLVHAMICYYGIPPKQLFFGIKYFDCMTQQQPASINTFIPLNFVTMTLYTAMLFKSVGIYSFAFHFLVVMCVPLAFLCKVDRRLKCD